MFVPERLQKFVYRRRPWLYRKQEEAMFSPTDGISIPRFGIGNT
jgi:hypothetical protein